MTHERFLALHDLYRRTLLDDIVPFWMAHSVDPVHGGYFSCLDRSGAVYNTDKSVWFQGRELWMLSRLSNTLLPGSTVLDAARSGYEFLTRHCYDADGRMFFTVTEDGRPLRKRRYFFSEAFAVIALAEYSRASGDETALVRARETHATMMDVYTGRRPVEPKIIPATRRLASLAAPLIVLATTDELRGIDPDPPYDDIVDRCISAIRNTFYHHGRDILVETVDLDGNAENIPSLRTVNPGHVIEAAWFLLHANRHLNDPEIRDFALHMIDRSLEVGWDHEYGGMFSFVDAEGKPPERLEWDMKMWWPHTEALYATLLAYQMTREDRYWRWYERIHEYAFSHFPDPEHGEWFGYLHRDGSVANTLKGSHWKGMFHIPRALLFCCLALEKLASDDR